MVNEDLIYSYNAKEQDIGLIYQTPVPGNILSEQSIEKLRSLIDQTGTEEPVNDYIEFTIALFDRDPDPREMGGYYVRLLLDRYKFLLFALFEDPGFAAAVVESDQYKNLDIYENQQHKANRRTFGKILQEYREILKDIDNNDFCKENILLEKSSFSPQKEITMLSADLCQFGTLFCSDLWYNETRVARVEGEGEELWLMIRPN